MSCNANSLRVPDAWLRLDFYSLLTRNVKILKGCCMLARVLVPLSRFSFDVDVEV